MFDLPQSILSRMRRFFRRLNRSLWRFLRGKRGLPTVAGVIIVCAVFYELALAAPGGAPMPAVVQIRMGDTLAEVSAEMQADHLVRHAGLLDFLVRLLGGNHRLQAGAYYFGEPQNVLLIAWRLRFGEFDIKPVRVVVQEGETVREITAALQNVPLFDAQEFLKAASGREGYLYPDTYFVYPGEDPVAVEQEMEQNFQSHLASVQTQLAPSGKPLPQLLTMASILVGEARTDTDRRIVSGILWKRIAKGLPLQVDAPFGYVLDKPLTKLTYADLKINSPYNTYTHKGLPPTPIGNPTVEALLAAAEPTQTNYLYYLSDPSGTLHYSATYAQHQAQLQAYY